MADKKKTIKMTQEDLDAAFTKHLVYEIFRAVELQDENQERQKQLLVTFLASFIGAVLYDTLAYKPKDITDKNDLYEYTSANYNALKVSVQDAVAAGFQGAMQTFSNKQVEYYCLVKTFGEPVNKQPC